MATFSLKTIQNLPVEIEEAWNFFSNPGNLPAITPPKMDFKIISTFAGNEIYAGQLIEYKVNPITGISIYWMTEITHVSNRKYFIDEQRFGPYRFWHHQHHFRAIKSGVEMTDIVHYRNPMGILGNLANALFIKKQLKRIFEYRFNKIEEMFGKWPGAQPNLVQFNKVA